MLKVFSIFGAYILLLGKVLRKPQKTKVFFKLFMREIYDLGVNSFGLVLFTSLFVGAVVAIQMYNNFKTASIPIPLTYIGHATKVVLILEFAPTIISVILAGKVGSYIASSIGTMRVTEQIDALDIMGINSPNFLILPKILACVIFNPLLIAIWRISCWNIYRSLDRSRICHRNTDVFPYILRSLCIHENYRFCFLNRYHSCFFWL